MKNMNESMNFNETEFQELFELYWKAGEGSKERSFVIEELNKCLYFYAIKKYPGEFDVASDFFADNIVNTKKWLEEYEPAYLISFFVYFIGRVKRRFFNYRSRIHKIKKMENVHEFYELNPEVFLESVFERKQGYLFENKSEIEGLTQECLSSLASDEEIAIKLYYGFPLTYKDFRFLFKKYNSRNIFELYRKYYTYLDRKLATEKNARENIIRKLYAASIRIQESADLESFSKRQRLLTYLENVKNLVPLRLVAEIFQTNITSVHRKVKRGEKKLKILLGNQLFINFENQENEDSKSADIDKAA